MRDGIRKWLGLDVLLARQEDILKVVTELCVLQRTIPEVRTVQIVPPRPSWDWETASQQALKEFEDPKKQN